MRDRSLHGVIPLYLCAWKWYIRYPIIITQLELRGTCASTDLLTYDAHVWGLGSGLWQQDHRAKSEVDSSMSNVMSWVSFLKGKIIRIFRRCGSVTWLVKILGGSVLFICICLLSSEYFVRPSRTHTLLSCCECVMVVNLSFRGMSIWLLP